MWLSKLFNLRDKTSRSRGAMAADEEKPFLSHLEDLRTMIVRVVITLMVMTILSFVFHKELLELIKGPARKAGIQTEVSLPSGISYVNWEQIRKLNLAGVPLSQEQRVLLLDAAFRDPVRWGSDADLTVLRQIADAHYAYLAAQQLSGDERSGFLQQALGSQPELLAQAMRLAEAETPADLDGKVSAITMQALSPTETFKLSIKLSLYAGIVIAFPLLFYFIAQFVFPGLTPKEKKMLWPSLTVGFGLFIVGVVFAYYFVTVEALKFFHGFSKGMGIEDQWKIGEYVSFTTQLILIFGISFELPVVVMALVKLDLLTHEFMRRTRSYAIIIILVIAAIITPTPDAVVLSALAGPMIILYEICIWLSWFMQRKDKKDEEASAPTLPNVTPAVGALPLGDDESGAAPEPGARPYDAPTDEAREHHHDPDHDPHHDDDEHHGDVDYDPYSSHDGYYDDYYKDTASPDTEDTGSDDEKLAEPESSEADDSAEDEKVDEVPEESGSESESEQPPAADDEGDSSAKPAEPEADDDDATSPPLG